MTDPIGIGAPPPPTPPHPVAAPAATAAATPPAVELLTPLAVLPTNAASFVATVIGRGPDGELMLQSAYGKITVKSPRPLPTGTRLILRVETRSPPSLAILSMTTEDAQDDAPMQIALGTTLEATMLAPNPDATEIAAGTRLLVRLVAPFLAADAGAALTGEVAVGSAGETLIETPIGTLSLDGTLSLPPGSAVALIELGAVTAAPDVQAATPSQAGGWPALDAILAALDRTTPVLAAALRAQLAPETPAALAGTIMFLMGALYGDRWPDERVARALSAAGADKLRLKLGQDIAELTRLSHDPATGSWRVMVLPFLGEAGVRPLRLYLRRDGAGGDGTDVGARFVVETELSRLGAIQLDGKLRHTRLDLVLRSRQPLVEPLRQEVEALFRRVSASNGLQGDIVFATVRSFAVSPLATQRRHVTIEA